ncbi:hypothetical protein [Pseudoalteromonas piscicida]
MKAKLIFASAALAVGLMGCNSDSSGPHGGDKCGDIAKSMFDITDFSLGEFKIEHGSEKDYFSISEFLNIEEKRASKFIQFALNSEPTYKQNHVFYIEISLDTGEQFSLESQELSFTE